ncbi:MAG: cobalamin biosynthesis protein, partial [Deltaproteobacteria bacterium]|nr:cobalamin biosynthesis protein [Deltaproteobacteria bacterium]
RFGLAIEDVKKIKPVNSAILKGGPVLIIDAEARRLKDIRAYLGNKDNGIFSFGRVLPAKPQAKACVFITSRAYTGLKRPMNDKTLILRPREFTAGVGCMRGVSSKEIENAVKVAFKEADISFLSIRNLSTIDIKRDEAGLKAFALRHGLGIDFFSVVELNKAGSASNPSAFVYEKTGARAVAEPASLLSSGAKKIWIRKRISGRVTVAASKALYTSLA